METAAVVQQGLRTPTGPFAARFCTGFIRGRAIGGPGEVLTSGLFDVERHGTDHARVEVSERVVDHITPELALACLGPMACDAE